MEARSLASLNELAANPPQYPEKPSEEKQEPLVLYISRVPGTRDVILSPFKPQVKNVTVQDVANSFYYIHMDAHHHDVTGPEGGRFSEDNPSVQAIPRKPLPGDSTHSLIPDGGIVSAYPAPPILRRENQTRARSSTLPDSWNRPAPIPVSQLADPGLDIPSHLLDQPPPPPPHQYFPAPARKPVGPRPPSGSPERQVDHSVFEHRVPRRAANPRLGDEGIQAADYARNARRSLDSRSRSPKKYSRSASPSGNPFTLTLIRRDPSSGTQWNVGKIWSHQVDTPADEQPSLFLSTSPPPVSHMPSSNAHPPIDIQLETSGYAKFRHMPSKANFDLSAGGETAAAVLRGLAELSTHDTGPAHGDPAFFSRQVTMAYSKSWTSNLRDKLQKIEQHSGWPGKGHRRNESDGSVESEHSADSADNTTGGPGKGMKARGYTFASPWDGRCEFRTGNGGRSLRLHHNLHDGQTATYNPLVAEQGSTAPRTSGSTVSELRFNLPGAELFPDQAKDTKAQLRGHFNKLLHRGDEHENGDDDDDFVSPFELNIGGEKAGGGNRGSRAKLGKLIIFNDGLKMLDLVIAANMGIWWGAWEKSF